MAKDSMELTPELLKDVIKTAVAEAVIATKSNDPNEMATLAAQAAASAAKTLQDQWWDEKTYPEISSLNPLGEKDHPRPEIVGEVFWAGARLRKGDLTREEIDLVNLLQPGDYWFTGNDDARLLLQIINLEPAGSNQRRLQVKLPGLTDPNTRSNYPSMRRILSEVVGAMSPA